MDMTIICSNGTIHSNSFLLATIFPVVRRVLETTLQYQEPAVLLVPDLDKTDVLEIPLQCQDPSTIIIPDLDVSDLETFLQHLQLHHNMFNISRDLKDLVHLQFDPTTLNRQGNDRGTQYRSGIYYHTDQQKVLRQIRVEVVYLLNLRKLLKTLSRKCSQNTRTRL